jgi:glycerate dehydrogenase
MTDRIIVLDGHALNPGDLDWSPFAGLGSLELHERTPEADIVTRAGGAGFVLLNKTPMSRATLARLPARYIGVLATGYNVVDLQAAREQGITVTNIPTYGTDSVAQHAAAMMLEFARGLTVHERAVREGEWTRNPDWCFARRPMFELNGRTLALIGLGRIGLAFRADRRLDGHAPVAHDRTFRRATRRRSGHRPGLAGRRLRAGRRDLAALSAHGG